MGEIILNKAIIHIVDKNVGDHPVLSEKELFLNEELEEFISGHIKKLMEDADTKKTGFLHESSRVLQMVQAYGREELEFIPLSQELAERVHLWNNQAEDTKSGDFLVVDFIYNGETYLGGLKLDYKTSFIHNISYPQENVLYCGIIPQQTAMPTTAAAIRDGFVIDRKSLDIIIKEKRYRFNDERHEYISEYVLEAKACLSDKQAIKIITGASKKILKENFNDLAMMGEAKDIIAQSISEENGVDVNRIAEQIFEGEDMRRSFRTQIKEEGLYQDVVPISGSSLKKENLTQRITTSDGIEITIPVEHMRRTDKVEFRTNMDGTVSIMLKNVEVLKER